MPLAAIRAVADQLITILMTLVDAVAEAGLLGNVPTCYEAHAENVFHRLSSLVTSLIRLLADGLPTPPRPKPADAAATASTAQPRPAPPASRDPQVSLGRLPGRPGWLLAALPDSAPAVAADLAALLADPALADLLAAAPKIARELEPILLALGLTSPLPAPPPEPAAPPPSPRPTPDPSATNPSDPPPPPTNPLPISPPSSPRSLHAFLVAIYQRIKSPATVD